MGKEKFSIYPLTIVCDHYSGMYSGGAYTAWNCEACDLPTEISSDDECCAEFWVEHDNDAIGRGSTPNKALEDLYNRL